MLSVNETAFVLLFLETWSEERRRVILLHELAHVKRLDVLCQLFSRAVCSLYWFHPLVWLGYQLLRSVRELACDDYVIESGIKLSDYAHHLLCVAREFQSPTVHMTVAITQPWGLERRIRAMMHHQGSRLPLPKLSSRFSVAVCMLLTVLLAIPKLSAGKPPEEEQTSSQVGSTESSKTTGSTDAELPAADEMVGGVVDSDGYPIADVLVDAWSWYPGNETRTDADGRFRLKFGSSREKIELRVMKESYSPLCIPQQSLGVRDFKITLSQKTYIEGVVRDSAGVPVPYVEVRGEQGPQKGDGVSITSVSTKTQTDDQGR